MDRHRAGVGSGGRVLTTQRLIAVQLALLGTLGASVAAGAQRLRPDEPVAPTPTPWSIEPHHLRELDRRQRIAVALLVALIVLTGIQVVRGLSSQDAVVVGDEALIALEAHDVTEVVPMTGKVTSAVLYGNLTLPKNPGPAESWTLAPFVWALGTSLGSWVYAYAVNLGCALLAAWAGFRRGGPRLGLLVLTTCLVMFAVTAPGGVSSVLNTRIVLMPLFATLIIAAMVALGDSLLLPALVVVSSFVIQTHIGYAPVAATAVLTAVAIVAWHATRRPRPAHLVRHLAVAAAVGLACWALPIYDQLFRSGNLRTLLTAQVPHAGPERALDAVGTIFNPRLIFLQRGELSSSMYSWPSWRVGLLLLAIVVWAIWRFRGRLANHKELLVLATTCVIAAAVTAALTPPNDTAGEHFYWIRAVAFFVAFVALLVLTDAAVGRKDVRHGNRGVFAWAAVLIVAVAPLWVPKDHTETEERAMAAVNALLPAVEAEADGPQPVAVAHQGYWPAIAVADGLIAELVDRSVPVLQIDDATSPAGYTTLVVTQGPTPIGDAVEATAPSIVDEPRRFGDQLVPAMIAKWARQHGPLELVGPGALSLADVLDGTAAELCVEDYLDEPAALLDLDPAIVADLYFQQQVAAPQLPPELQQAVARWGLARPTEMHLAPPQAPDEPADDLILSTSSC